MDLLEINDIQLGKLIGTKASNIELRDIITGEPRIINKDDENFTIDRYFSAVSSKTNYDKNLCNYIRAIADFEGIVLYSTNNKELKKELDELDDEFIDIFKKYKYKDFWKYQIEINLNDLINEIERERYEKNYVDLDPSNNFLNNIPNSLHDKTKQIIDKNKEDDYYLNACETDVWGLQNYEEEVFTKGTFLNQLYECKTEGIGKGEVLSTYLIKNSVINGTSESYDLFCFLDKKRGELKSMPKLGSSFRLGVKGGIGTSRLYNNINEAIKLIRELLNDIGEDYFKQHVSSYFYLLTKQMLGEIDENVKKGEISNKRLYRIELWFFIAHTELYLINHPYDIKQNVITRKFESKGNILKALEHLRYVKNPLKFKEDITYDIEQFFNVDYLIVFDEQRKKISIVTKPEELTLDTISQNSLKIIEKRCKPKNECVKLLAFREWEKDKSLNYYDLYIKVKKELLNVC